MEKKTCPFRGYGQKSCVANCVLAMPRGCALVLIAHDKMLAESSKQAKPKKVKRDD